MATLVSSWNNEFHSEEISAHLELFTLIWLDASESVHEDLHTQQQLRAIINRLEKFRDVQECRRYIERRVTDDRRLVLVVSGRLRREIVPSIHLLRQVSSIYVYCMDKETNEKWACRFPKVGSEVSTDVSLFIALTGEGSDC